MAFVNNGGDVGPVGQSHTTQQATQSAPVENHEISMSPMVSSTCREWWERLRHIRDFWCFHCLRKWGAHPPPCGHINTDIILRSVPNSWITIDVYRLKNKACLCKWQSGSTSIYPLIHAAISVVPPVLFSVRGLLKTIPVITGQFTLPVIAAFLAGLLYNNPTVKFHRWYIDDSDDFLIFLENTPADIWWRKYYQGHDCGTIK